MRVYYLVLCGAFFACSCNTVGAMLAEKTQDEEALKKKEQTMAVKEQVGEALEQLSGNWKKFSIPKIKTALTLTIDCLAQVQKPDDDGSLERLIASLKTAADLSPKEMKSKENRIKGLAREAERHLNSYWPYE